MAYAPAGSTTQSAGFNHLATVYYERRGLNRVKARYFFAQVCEPHPIPLKSGKTIQMYRFSLPGQNTVPSAEGVIGTPVSQASSTISATVEQYSDFMSASQLLEDTDINSTNDQMVDDLSYRAAGTVDTIIRTEIDSNTSAQVSTIGSTMTAQDAKQQVALLKGANVVPFEGDRDGGNFIGILHPYITYDLISDNTAGGFIDSLKYAQGTQVLNGEIGKVAGVRWMESTNVGTTGSAPNVLYYTYIFGKGGVGIVDLEGRGPDRVSDPANQQFKIQMVKGGPNPADPVGEIAMFASYRFVFAAKTLDTSTYRFKSIKADASVV